MISDQSNPTAQNPSDSNDPIKMHILVSSHMDPGWTYTFEELYQGVEHQGGSSVKSILNNVFEALVRDPKRKYSMAEVSYFERWWRDQSEERRNIFRGFLKNNQFEFINGGWTANDEACAYYEDIMDNFVLGQRWLRDNFGLDSLLGWQIDSFGNSATHAALMAQAGYEGFFFSRADEIDRELRRKEKRLQFNWKPKNPHNESVFTQMLYVLYADIRFLALNERTMFVHGRLPVEAYGKIADYMKTQSEAFRTKNILFLVCDDFYLTKDAERDYDGLEAITNHFIAHPEFGIKPKYSSLQEFLDESKQDLINQGPDFKLPEKYSDFFAYVDNKWTCWTGYYTSKSMFKLMTREYSQYYNAVKLLFAKLLLSGDKNIANLSGNKQFEVANEALLALEKPLGIAQHHDAVTGTMKDRVRYDYESMLIEGRAALDKTLTPILKSYLDNVLGESVEDTGVQYDWLFRDEKYENIFNTQNNIVVTTFNPGHTRKFLIKIKVPNNGYSVINEANEVIEADLIYHDLKCKEDCYLYFLDEIPSFSFRSYKIIKSSNTMIVEPEAIQGKEQVLKIDENVTLTIFEDLKTLKYEHKTSQGKSLSDILQLDYEYYESSVNVKGGKNPSGAYIFAPRTQEKFRYSKITTGRIYKAKHFTLIQIFRDDLRTDIKLIHSQPEKGIEIESHLEPVKDYANGKEIILIIRSQNINNENHIFHTDGNGYYMVKRQKDHREDFVPFLENGVETNYFSITSSVYIEDTKTGQRLSVVTDRSQGTTSANPGELEVMIHRVTVRDDAKGVEETLKEVDPKTGDLVKVTTRHSLLYSQPDLVEDQRRSRQYDVDRPLQFWFHHSSNAKFVGQAASVKKGAVDDSVLPDLVKIYIRSYKAGEYIIRLHNLDEVKTKVVKLYDSVDHMSQLLSQFAGIEGIKVSSVTELSWTTTRLKSELKINSLDPNATQPKSNDGEGYTSVSLLPMEIRTFNVVVS